MRCIKPLLSLALVTVVIVEHRKNIFSDTPKRCSVFCISAEHRHGGEVDCGEGGGIEDKGTTTHPFF